MRQKQWLKSTEMLMHVILLQNKPSIIYLSALSFNCICSVGHLMQRLSFQSCSSITRLKDKKNKKKLKATLKLSILHFLNKLV